MIKAVSVFLLVLLVLGPASFHAPEPILAQDAEDAEEGSADDAGEVSDRRPFNRVLTDDEVREAIGEAVKGSEDAIQKLKDGRLGYVHVLIRDRRSRQFAHRLLREESDWVKDMQRWEVALMGMDATAIEAAFEELRDRFYHEHGQLARAIIKAHNLGDREATARLVSLSPENSWVKGAQAWTAQVADTVERLELLLAILKESMDLSLWNWLISPGLVDEQVSRHRYASDEYVDGECRLFMTRAGINRLGAVPTEWTHGAFFERMGTLAYELPEPARREIADRLLQILGPEGESGLPYLAFEFGAWPDKTYPQAQVHYSHMNLARSTVVMRYAKEALADDRLSQRFAAISTFWGQPDWAPAQEFLLREAIASGDSVFGNIAMRAVLLVNPDSIRAISSVARALASADEFKEEREAFLSALKTSGKEPLLQIAQAKYPDDLSNPSAGLDTKGQAQLLKPFLTENEIKTYHGLEAAWWMNRSQFLFAQHKMIAAMEAASHSIELASKVSERTIAQANAYLIHRTLRAMLGVRNVDTWLANWEKRFPLATEYLQKQVEAWKVEKPKGVEYAVYAVEQELMGGASADDEQFEALKSDPSIAGGYGLTLVALMEARSFNLELKQQLMDMAEHTTPTDWTIYFQRMPYSDWLGRFSGRDWSVAEQLTQRVSLLQPYKWTTFEKIGGLLARGGCNPRSMSPLMLQALDRPIQPYQGGSSPREMALLLFSRGHVSNLLQTNGGVNPDHLPEGWRNTYMTALEKMCWGLKWWESIKWGPQFSPRDNFSLACYQNEYDLRDKENVGLLLDYALELQGTMPEKCLELVAEAERIGVSPYGHFVGSQTYIRAKAHVGEYAAALKRWKELRDGDVGYPPYLDYMLLHGLCEGNQWQHINDALDHVLEYEQDENSMILTFALRRSLMAAGRHEDVSQISPPQWVVRSSDGYNNGNYTEVFYEARRLFERGRTEEIRERVVHLNRDGAESSIGVTVDAHLLRVLAGKLQPDRAAEYELDDHGMLHAIHEDDFWWWRPSRTLDYQVLEILTGRRKYQDLAKINGTTTWHGLEYGERPQANKGAGLLRRGEALARDDFIRGVLAYIADDFVAARKHLQACVDADQRCSHEYHVAEWLLDKQMPKKD